MIVNIGEDSFSDELRKPEGWIVAKDIYTALRHSGNMADQVLELNACAGAGIGAHENLYLQGHGSAGALGDFASIGILATKLRRLPFPDGYAGEIRIYSCSAGKAERLTHFTIEDGISQLRKQLGLVGVTVSGAAGVALNSPDYVGGTRVIQDGAGPDARVDAQIAATRGPVDAAWLNYLPTIGGVPFSQATIRAAAARAYAICGQFYRDLEIACHDDLKPIGTDIKVGQAVGGRPRASTI